MECNFCKKKNSLVSRNYHFWHGIEINQSWSSLVDPNKVCFEFSTKYTEKVYGTQFGHHNCILIPLCVTELTQLLYPDKKEDILDFGMPMKR